LPETLWAEDSVVHGNAERHTGNQHAILLTIFNTTAVSFVYRSCLLSFCHSIIPSVSVFTFYIVCLYEE